MHFDGSLAFGCSDNWITRSGIKGNQSNHKLSTYFYTINGEKIVDFGKFSFSCFIEQRRYRKTNYRFIPAS